LVFFDEYTKRIPYEFCDILVSLGQSIQCLSAVKALLTGIRLLNFIGLGGSLWVSGGLRLIGFLLILIVKKYQLKDVALPSGFNQLIFRSTAIFPF
jgi:hypothetical protein